MSSLSGCLNVFEISSMVGESAKSMELDGRTKLNVQTEIPGRAAEALKPSSGLLIAP